MGAELQAQHNSILLSLFPAHITRRPADSDSSLKHCGALKLQVMQETATGMGGKWSRSRERNAGKVVRDLREDIGIRKGREGEKEQVWRRERETEGVLFKACCQKKVCLEEIC